MRRIFEEQSSLICVASLAIVSQPNPIPLLHISQVEIVATQKSRPKFYHKRERLNSLAILVTWPAFSCLHWLFYTIHLVHTAFLSFNTWRLASLSKECYPAVQHHLEPLSPQNDIWSSGQSYADCEKIYLFFETHFPTESAAMPHCPHCTNFAHTFLNFPKPRPPHKSLTISLKD